MNPAPDLVSCIVIFLDEARFLDEAVRSIVAQTHTRWELLLVDDGSTDGSPAIARRWAAAHPDRIRVLQHPGGANRGMSASRNLGLAHARGDFVAFLDADDVWLPGKLAEQLALFRAHPEAGVVCGATELWWSWDPDAGTPDRRMEVGTPWDRPDAPSPLRDVLVQPPALALALYPLGKGYSPSTSNYLLRRAAVERVGGYEDAFRAMYEDQAFQIKLYLTTPIFVATAVWDRYRQHPASSSAGARRAGQVHRDRGRFLAWLGGYLASGAPVDPAVRRAHAAAEWPYAHPRLFEVRQLLARLLAWPRALVARRPR